MPGREKEIMMIIFKRERKWGALKEKHQEWMIKRKHVEVLCVLREHLVTLKRTGRKVGDLTQPTTDPGDLLERDCTEEDIKPKLTT